MAEPPAKRLDQKMEPDIAELERGKESDKNGQNAPRLDIEAVRVELVCNICLDVPSHVATVLPCLHSFCWCCIEEWFKKHRKCPRCSQSASSAKPNAALNNLVQALLEADPALAKPEELIAQEKEKLTKYKTQKSPTAVLYPHTGYGTEDDDNESDMDAEDFRHYWPCPCCSPGNRSGYLCANPIPVPPGAIGLAGGPVRGGEWPPLEEAEDFLPLDKVAAHALCDTCGSWLPAHGVPEAQCAGCGLCTCSPYDAEGVCPQGEALAKVGSTDFTFQDISSSLSVAGLNTVEIERIQSYMLDKNLSVNDIVTSTSLRARELAAGKEAQGAEDGSAQLREVVDNAAAVPEDDERPYKDEALFCLIRQGAGCWMAFCHDLNSDHASVLDNALFCVHCARVATSRLIEWWWVDIRTNQHDTLPESIRSLKDCPHGLKCPTHKRDPAHAADFNHFCKEKVSDQPENPEVAAAQVIQA